MHAMCPCTEKNIDVRNRPWVEYFLGKLRRLCFLVLEKGCASTQNIPVIISLDERDLVDKRLAFSV